MIDPVTFFKAFGIAVGILLLLSGLIFWITYFAYKMRFKIKHFIKYRVLRKKVNEEDVRFIMDQTNLVKPPQKLEYELLLLNKYDLPKIKELLYIYSQMRKSIKKEVKII